ncbi:hypothetical protein BKA93DRAFT_817976 [Sparassis latifolia]
MPSNRGSPGAIPGRSLPRLWLREPAWIDGGVNSPHFYHTHAKIADAVQAAANAGIRVPAVGTSADVSLLAGADMPVAAPPVAGPPVFAPQAVVQPGVAPPMVAVELPAAPASTCKLHIVLEGIKHTGFIQAFLAVHDLADQFSPGVHSGPNFKLWWTGSSGGKTQAPTIENDHQFEVALGALLKKSKGCQVSVEFNTDLMGGFRIRKLVPLANSNLSTVEDELLYGTKVPHVESFSEQVQLHGYCYIMPNGEHVGLNSCKLKSWASAIAAVDATKHMPPHTIDFDGAHNGRNSVASSRGRTGPHSGVMQPSSASFIQPSSSSFTDPTALLIAAMLPLIVELSRKHGRSPSPMHAPPPCTPTRSRVMPPVFSPMPGRGAELRSCLSAFAEAKGIDLTACENDLLVLEFTPDVISEVSCARLCEVTGAVEGKVVKLQTFCKGWSARLEKKRLHLSGKHRCTD